MSTTVALPTEVEVVNVGLPMFADAVRAQGAPVQHVDWRPPPDADATTLSALATLYGDRAAAIDAANAEVVRRLDVAVPELVTVAPAREVVPGLRDRTLGERTLLHPGPPLTWDRVVDPVRRSMRAAVVAEGWAADVDAADGLLAAGEVELAPANHHDAVVPMAAAVTPGAPVLVVEHQCDGDGPPVRAFAPITQGPGEAPWFGRDTPGAVERLRLVRDHVGPAMASVLASTGPLDVLALAQQGIAMGDDVHMRTQGATNLLARRWLPEIVALPDEHRGPFARFLADNHLFFLTLAMAAAKSLTLWAGEVTGSTIVTSMARNATSFGVRVAGSDRWYVTDAPPVGDALYHPGYGPATAAADVGDSAVLELVGLGGPAAANSPAVAAFLGGTMADAAAATEAFRHICVATSSRFTLSSQGFSGTPVGVDARRVVALGITPQVNTGILAATSGEGQIGAGVATAPRACFREAVTVLADRDGRAPVGCGS